MLGKTVYTPNGAVLLVEGTSLSQGYLSALDRRGFTASIYVEDGLSDDVRPNDIDLRSGPRGHGGARV